MTNNEQLSPGQELRARRTALGRHGSAMSEQDEAALLAAQAAYKAAEEAETSARKALYRLVAQIRDKKVAPADIARKLGMDRGHVHRMISAVRKSPHDFE